LVLHLFKSFIIMKTPKRKRTIGQPKFSPPVGFQIAPSAPAGAGSNIPAMRPTYAFLPYNADDINKRIYVGKLDWKSKNQSVPDKYFPGIPDVFGTGSVIGAGSAAGEAPPAPVVIDRNAECRRKGGRIWMDKSQQCECPSGWYAFTRTGDCIQMLPG
jgi:hypothetical protein